MSIAAHLPTHAALTTARGVNTCRFHPAHHRDADAIPTRCRPAFSPLTHLGLLFESEPFFLGIRQRRMPLNKRICGLLKLHRLLGE